jgi:hypothetical protein
VKRNRSAKWLGVSPEALDRHRENEALRLKQMVARLGAQMDRQAAWRRENPAFSADWDRRWGDAVPDMNPVEARKHIQLSQRKAA